MALTDAQVDAIFNADVKALGCTWLEGSAWPYTRCGAEVIAGKHNCAEHYARSHVKNSAVRNKRKAKFIEAEIREAEMADSIEAGDEPMNVDEPLTVEIG